MATRLGIVQLASTASYELAYDLLGQNTIGNYSTVRLYGILHVTGYYISWSSGSASVHTSGLQGIGTRYNRGDHVLIQRDFTIGHDANGNLSAYIGASIRTTYVNGDCGGTLTLPRILRQANMTSANNVTDEENPSFNFSNPGNFDLIAELEINPTNTHLFSRAIPNTGSYTFNLTSQERDTIREYLKNTNTATLRYLLYSNNRQFVSYLDRTISMVNANPILGEWDFYDSNEKTVALTGDNKKFINEYSNATAKITSSATPIKKATISKYRFTNGSKFVENTDYKKDFTITGISTATMTLTAYDSRGNTGVSTKIVDKSNYINYTKPYFSNIKAERKNGTSQDVVLKFSGKFWNGNFGIKDNTISFSYRFKNEGSNEWINGDTKLNVNINGNDFSCEQDIQGDLGADGFTLDKNFTLEIILSDELTKDLSDSTLLGAGSPAIAIYKNCVSLGGPYDESKGGRIQIDGIPLDEYIKNIK